MLLFICIVVFIKGCLFTICVNDVVYFRKEFGSSDLLTVVSEQLETMTTCIMNLAIKEDHTVQLRNAIHKDL